MQPELKKIMISVVIPAYNSEETVGQCLKALTEQSFPADSYEVILVDDGSTDRTGEIARTYPVKYIKQKNQGPASARNNGAQTAKGEIILFTDSDCVPISNWIKEMYKPFKNRQVMAVKGAYRTQQKSLTARFAQIEFEERFELLKKAESIDMVDTYSAGFRKEIFLTMKGFDTSFPEANNEDTELSYRMSALNYKMVFNPDAIVYHLDHPDSVRRYCKLKFGRGYWRMVVYKRFPDKMVKDTYTPPTLKLQILFLYLSLLFFVLGLSNATYKLPLSVCLSALVFSIAPFTVFATKRAPVIGFVSVFFILLRAISLGAGMIRGIFHTGTIRES